jgi:hypothetical protein
MSTETLIEVHGTDRYPQSREGRQVAELGAPRRAIIAFPSKGRRVSYRLADLMRPPLREMIWAGVFVDD